MKDESFVDFTKQINRLRYSDITRGIQVTLAVEAYQAFAAAGSVGIRTFLLVEETPMPRNLSSSDRLDRYAMTIAVLVPASRRRNMALVAKPFDIKLLYCGES